MNTSQLLRLVVGVVLLSCAFAAKTGILKALEAAEAPGSLSGSTSASLPSSSSSSSSSSSLGLPPSPSSSSSASPTSPSSSSSNGGVSDDEVRTGGSEVRLLNGHKGGKLLIFENKNDLVKVDVPRVRIDQRAAQEENRKQINEEMKKKEESDARADAREQRVKNDRRERQQREISAEADTKKAASEQMAKQTDEADKKSKLAAQAKEDAFKQDSARAQEQNQKDQSKQQEQAQKNRQEQDQKANDKRREEDEKNRAEQEIKRSQITFTHPWRHFGGEYQESGARTLNGICYLTGLAAGDWGLIGTTPSSCRPGAGRLIFNVMKGGVNSRIDILQDGRIYHIAGGGTGWLSFNSIYFPIDVDRPLSLQNGWVNYGGEYRQTTVTKRDNICFVSGLIRSGRWGYLAQAPGDCNPDMRLIFSANNHDTVGRIDVVNNGGMHWVGGSNNHGWINLDGMAWMQNGGNDLALQNGWMNYGWEYRPARWSKSGRTCVISGLIKSGSWQTTIATIPDNSGCRPAKRLIFGCNVHIRDARVDVLPSGEIQYINGKANWEWLSLDSITYVV